MTDVSQTKEARSETTTDKFKSQFSGFKSQASDKARDYADKGKARATDALDEAAKFLEDTARTVEEKLGPQYGRYGFSAAESVSGFATQLRGKEVDELVDDARGLVRKSPAVAIGAAVAIGFVLARLAKAGAGFEHSSSPKDGGIVPVGTNKVEGLKSTGMGTGTGMAGMANDPAGGNTFPDDRLPSTPTFPA